MKHPNLSAGRGQQRERGQKGRCNRACFIVEQRYGHPAEQQRARFYVNSFSEALEVVSTTPPDWEHGAIYLEMVELDAPAEVVVEAHTVGAAGFIYRLASGAEVLELASHGASLSTRMCLGSKVYG